jgi:hypothetical protein
LKKGSFPFLQALIVIIVVVSSAQFVTQVHAKGIYDFTDYSNAAQAVWQTGSGNVTFPGISGDPRGYALIVSNASLEGEVQYPSVLETHPEYVSNGYIMGTYPSRTVSPNERMIVLIGFLTTGYSIDGANYQVRFLEKGENSSILLNVHADYDDHLDKYTIDLSAYAGKVGRFVLYVNGGENPDNDYTVWAEAYIEQVAAADLKIDSFWLSNGVVHYKFTNAGAEALGSPGSPVDFTNVLEVNHIPASQDKVSLYLAPGQSVERTFGLRWQLATSNNTVRVTLDANDDVSETNENNNSMEEIWHIIPDLNPASITWSPKLPGLGQSIDTFVVVRNLGNMTSHPCNGLFTVNGSAVANVKIPSVLPWSYVNVSIGWGPVLVGKNNLVFYVDSNNTLVESNKNNNVIQATVIGGSNPPIVKKPDLVADGLAWVPSVPKTNKMMAFTPVVSNLGTVGSATCKLSLVVNGTTIGTVLIPLIPASKSLSDVGNVSINWLPTVAGKYIVQEIVDLDNVVAESNKTNNLYLGQFFVKVNDEPLPSVDVSVSPVNPTELDPVVFHISSSDVAGISSISLYVNDSEVGFVENNDQLVQTVGPYKSGTELTYWVRSEDASWNVYLSPHYTLVISSSIPMDGRVAVNLSPSAATSAYVTSAVITTTFSSTKQIKFYLNDTLDSEASNRNNLTVPLGRLHAGEVFSYYAEAFSVSGEVSRTQLYEVVVPKVSLQLSISVNKDGIIDGDTIELKGLVSSDDPQLSINLLYRRADSVNTTIVHPNSLGEFSGVFKPSGLGEWEVTASVTNHQDYFISESPPIKFNVYSRYSLNNPQLIGALAILIVSAIIVGFVFYRRRSSKRIN